MCMAIFKVNFENNAAISGEVVPALLHEELTRLETEGSKTVLKWCIVDADHEDEALQRANQIARIRWKNIVKAR
jgi:hypothetical protein